MTSDTTLCFLVPVALLDNGYNLTPIATATCQQLCLYCIAIVYNNYYVPMTVCLYYNVLCCYSIQ